MRTGVLLKLRERDIDALGRPSIFGPMPAEDSRRKCCSCVWICAEEARRYRDDVGRGASSCVTSGIGCSLSHEEVDERSK